MIVLADHRGPGDGAAVGAGLHDLADFTLMRGLRLRGDHRAGGHGGGGQAHQNLLEHDLAPSFLLRPALPALKTELGAICRSEEHTSELQSLMRISYAVFCLKKKKRSDKDYTTHNSPSTINMKPNNK